VNFSHAVQVGARVLEIAAAGQFVMEGAANLYRGSNRPGAIRVDAEREIAAKFLTKRANRLDFDIWWQHAAL